MVGFIREPTKEENSGAVQPKLKSESENYKFDFDSHSADFDEFSFSSVQPFLDFDAFKDWIEEMQDPDRERATKVTVGSGLGVVESFPENPIDMNAVDNKIEIGGDDRIVKPCEIKEEGTIVNSAKSESGHVLEPAEIKYDDGHNDEIKTSHGDESCIGVLGAGNSETCKSLGCLIEEGLQKVSLVGDAEVMALDAGSIKETKIASVSDGNDCDSDSESESGSEASSTSSSASSSSSESDDDDEEEEKEKEKEEEQEKVKEKSCHVKSENSEQKVDVEEGEIMGSDSEKMVSWSDNDGDSNDKNDSDDEELEVDEEFEVGELDDDDDEEGNGDKAQGPIKSKNELTVLPPVPPVNVTLQPSHQIMPVGVVSSVLGAQVIVEGSEKHNPLSEGSILWIAETRSPLGIVDEIFGPVKTPYYIVRYNSESEVPSGIQNGSLIGFVPEFVDHVLNDKSIYQKGYDASGENDEELFDEVEFSDDEKEAGYKRMMKMSKRGNNNQGPGNKKKNRSNLKNRERTWTKDQSSGAQAPAAVQSQPNQKQQSNSNQMQQSNSNQMQQSNSNQMQQSNSNQMQRHLRASLPISSQGNSGPSLSDTPLPHGQTAFPQPAQPPGFLLNGLWANNVPFQQQNMALPSGFPINGMPWLQQNPQAQQMPSINPALLQQQQMQQFYSSQFLQTNPALSQQPFDLSQLISGNSAPPFGPMSFAGGPANSPWPGMLVPNQAPLCFPGAGAQMPGFSGIMSNEPQPGPGQGSNTQSATSFPLNTGPRPQFNQGFSSGGGRGRKSFHRRGGGGRFGGGRGR